MRDSRTYTAPAVQSCRGYCPCGDCSISHKFLWQLPFVITSKMMMNTKFSGRGPMQGMPCAINEFIRSHEIRQMCKRCSPSPLIRIVFI